MTLRFSIVIPNYNSGPVLERAIRSLVDQRYPDLQLILCDSESDDESRGVIERYRDVFDVLLIEKDDGQADGLNRGFRRADGDVFGWLCADDELLPGALAHAAELFAAEPKVDVVTGACRRIYADGTPALSPPDPDPWAKVHVQCCIEQSATFWRARLHRQLGELDTTYDFTFDWDWWNRMRRAGARIRTTRQLMSVYHFSEENKTGTAGDRFVAEAFRVVRRYGPLRGYLAYVYRFLYRRFDLRGCYDTPPTGTPARMRAFAWTHWLLERLIGRRLLHLYNWHFASCQARDMKWW